MSTKTVSLFDREIMQKAVVDSFTKLNPKHQLKNPVMFVTLIGAALTFQQLFTSKEPFGYVLQIALWLLFTVVFANFAEAVAEGRGKAQARALRASRKQLVAKRRNKDGAIGIRGRLRASQGRPRGRDRGRAHPRRRRGRRGCGVGRRIGHHRRVRAGHPGGGRRPERRHGRHGRPFRPASSSASRPTRARASSTT